MEEFLKGIENFSDQIGIFLLIIRYAVPVILVIAGFILASQFRKKGLTRLQKIAEKFKWPGYKIVVDSLQGVSSLWIILGGFYLAIPTIPNTIPINDSIRDIFKRALLAIFLLSVTLCVSRLAIGFLILFTQKDDEDAQLTTLFQYITKVVVFTMGILITLESIGIEITPLLTAFGVGGVSIGLALQGTLSNLMSGINILTSKKIKPGNYIELNNGVEGYVVDIELKYTVIQDLTENLLVIPNSELISSTFTNYSLPDRQMILPVDVGISYDSDLEKVEIITLDVAKETMIQVEGGVPDYEPFLRYNKFDYFSINFTVYLRIQEYFDRLVIRHEFLKRLHKRYQIEGIKIPFPIEKIGFLPEKN